MDLLKGINLVVRIGFKMFDQTDLGASWVAFLSYLFSFLLVVTMLQCLALPSFIIGIEYAVVSKFIVVDELSYGCQPFFGC